MLKRMLRLFFHQRRSGGGRCREYLESVQMDY